MMGNQNPVGVFDSGVGGIGTLSALRRELPQEDFLYFGDTLHAPYGTKPREEVMACVTRVMTHLLSNHVKAVVIACNTAPALPAGGVFGLHPGARRRREGTAGDV